jgi:ribosomal-protein-alanine N-acetyltransferase
VGYALSGRDARQVFLQRLAVRPEVQRRGIARALVDDCLAWAARWHAERVLVNTHVGNDAALALYANAGFHRLAERLHVFERVFE